MLVCAIFAQFGTRDRGCSAHPAFPAPSIFEGGKEFCITRAKSRREIADARSPHVVPAKAGTHTPRRMLFGNGVDGFARTTQPCGYGSLLSQGRRIEVSSRGMTASFPQIVAIRFRYDLPAVGKLHRHQIVGEVAR